MDLPHNLVLTEARNKLKGTYMTVNGSLLKMEIFNDEYITGFNSKGIARSFEQGDIDYLGLWIPETGVYLCKDKRHTYLEKVVKRHYHLSFSWDFFCTPCVDDGADAFELFNGRKVEDYYVQDGHVLYRDMHIGTMEVCKNPLFKYEYNAAMSIHKKRFPNEIT
jgi:hypothetical protein